MHNFKKLTIWQLSMELATLVYKSTNSFPNSEMYGLTSQIRRTAVSISSNIAEGSGRNTDKDFARFLDISIGSSFELETQIEIAFLLEYLEKDIYEVLIQYCSQLQKMIYSFRKKLKTNTEIKSLES
ncbi:MAG TPA: four helix bundle protein [Chitinophagales bacterium]|nr:four helix bundle protein [Chitinophagales bacterium]